MRDSLRFFYFPRTFCAFTVKKIKHAKTGVAFTASPQNAVNAACQDVTFFRQSNEKDGDACAAPCGVLISSGTAKAGRD